MGIGGSVSAHLERRDLGADQQRSCIERTSRPRMTRAAQSRELDWLDAAKHVALQAYTAH